MKHLLKSHSAHYRCSEQRCLSRMDFSHTEALLMTSTGMVASMRLFTDGNEIGPGSGVRIALVLTNKTDDDFFLLIVPCERYANGFLWPFTGPATQMLANPIVFSVPCALIPGFVLADRVFLLTSAEGPAWDQLAHRLVKVSAGVFTRAGQPVGGCEPVKSALNLIWKTVRAICGFPFVIP